MRSDRSVVGADLLVGPATPTAPSEIAPSARRANREIGPYAAAPSFAWWALCAAIVAIGLPFELTKLVHHDVAYYIDAGGRLLDGARLYRDLIEVNPPVMYPLAMIPVALARAVGIDAVTMFNITIAALAFGSVALAIRVGRIVRATGDLSARWLAPPALFAFLVLPGLNFGQREHILAMLLFPYLVAASGTVSALPKRLGIGIGLMAGLGTALKPHFALYLIVAEVLVYLRDRDARALLRPTVIAAVAIPLLAAAITVVALPEYLSFIVPLGRAVYGGYESPLALVMWQRDFIFVVPLVAALVFVRRRPAARETERLALVFAGAALAGMVVFLLQMKGWRYQMLPAISFAAIGLGMAVTALAATAAREGAARAPVLASAILLVLAMALTAGASADDRAIKADAVPLIELAKREAPGQPIVFLSTHLPYAFPVVNESGATWPHHYHHLLPLPGLYRDYDPARTGRPYRTPAEMSAVEAQFFHTVVSDAVKYAPKLIFVDRRRQFPPISDLGFDFIEYFSQDPRFVELLSHYRPAGSVSGHHVLVRAD